MTLQAKDFGVVGDGATDDTPGLIALRDTIRSGADRVWRVEFEPGHYCYSDNRWAMFGDRSVVLELNHSTVECFADALLPLGTGPLAWDIEYPTRKTSTNGERPLGHLIETVGVGSREVRFKAAVASQLVPGDAVLVAGDIQQTREESDGSVWNWGWPPNFRFFEYKTVAEVVDEFTARFLDPFRFGYDDGWEDFPANSPIGVMRYGAPRLWRCRLDDGRHVNRALTIRNANFIGGRDRQAGTKTALAAKGLHVTLENCSTSDDNAFWPTIAKRVDLIDCRLSRMEMDKIVESVRMDGGEIYGGMSSGGAGVLDARFKDVKFYGFVQVTPRRSWIFDQCHAYDGVMMSKGLTNTPFALTSAASDM
jgi:hypothetical protein